MLSAQVPVEVLGLEVKSKGIGYPPRPPPRSHHPPHRSLDPLKVPSKSRPFPHHASGCLARNEPHLPRMARPRRLRLRARARALARLRTHLSSRLGNPLLVANHPALAITRAALRVVYVALPGLSRYRQHCPLRIS